MFFFNDTATTEIYTLSLHDALPIYAGHDQLAQRDVEGGAAVDGGTGAAQPGDLALDQPRLGERVPALGRRQPGHGDRKSTRLNSSHANISYAVFCLKKKNEVEDDNS